MINLQNIKDFSKIAQGALSTFGSLKSEIDVIVKSRIEKILVSKGLVTKEEFDVAISRINDLEAELETIKLNLKKQRTKNTKTTKI